jgi:hypothetical protein
MKALFSPFVGRVLGLARSLGPFAAIELLLPGGSVLAVLYWWYRHRSRQERAPRGARPLRGALQVQSSEFAVRRMSLRAAESRSLARVQPRNARRSPCDAAAA